MKIYNVTFNDGGWHESLPKFQVVDSQRSSCLDSNSLKGLRYFIELYIKIVN